MLTSAILKASMTTLGLVDVLLLHRSFDQKNPNPGEIRYESVSIPNRNHLSSDGDFLRKHSFKNACILLSS